MAGGAENVFGDLEGLHGPVSLEECTSRDVDLMLLSEDSPTPRLPIVAHGTVSASVEVSRPGLGEAAVIVARVIHPEAFR